MCFISLRLYICPIHTRGMAAVQMWYFPFPGDGKPCVGVRGFEKLHKSLVLTHWELQRRGEGVVARERLGGP